MRLLRRASEALLTLVPMLALQACVSGSAVGFADCSIAPDMGNCPASGSTAGSSKAGIGSPEVGAPPSAIAAVVEDAPDVGAAAARSEAAADDVERAKALFRPTVSFDATASLRAGDRHPYAANEPTNPYSYAVTARIPLYQGGRAQSAVDLAEAEKRVALAQAGDIQLATTYELGLALTEISRNRSIMEVLGRLKNRYGSLLREVEAERREGSATAVDTADVGRQIVRIDVRMAKADLAVSRAMETLRRLKVDGLLELSELERALARLPSDPAQLWQLAMDNNPRLAGRKANHDVADARVRRARSEYNPSLSVDLTAGGDGDAVSYSHLNEASAKLRFSVPLYTGGARESAIDAEKNRALAAALENDAASQGVRAAIATAISVRAQAQDVAAEAARELTILSRQIVAVREERKLGERSVYDEIRAIGDHAEAEIDLVQARYDTLTATVTLAAEAGVLDLYLGASRPTVRQTAAAPRQVALRDGY